MGRNFLQVLKGENNPHTVNQMAVNNMSDLDFINGAIFKLTLRKLSA